MPAFSPLGGRGCSQSLQALITGLLRYGACKASQTLQAAQVSLPTEEPTEQTLPCSQAPLTQKGGSLPASHLGVLLSTTPWSSGGSCQDLVLGFIRNWVPSRPPTSQECFLACLCRCPLLGNPTDIATLHPQCAGVVASCTGTCLA